MLTKRTTMFDKLTAQTTGTGFPAGQTQEYAKTFQLIVTGIGAVSASASIYVSNDNVNWIPTALGKINVSGTNTANDGFAVNANWGFYRADLDTISGTSASASLIMGA